jgi:uncharacterized membrane protein
MSVAELLPTIQALPKAERLRLVQDILATLELEEKTSEQPYQKLLALTGFIEDPVTRNARDNAEDEMFEASRSENNA